MESDLELITFGIKMVGYLLVILISELLDSSLISSLDFTIANLLIFAMVLLLVIVVWYILRA